VNDPPAGLAGCSSARTAAADVSLPENPGEEWAAAPPKNCGILLCVGAECRMWSTSVFSKALQKCYCCFTTDFTRQGPNSTAIFVASTLHNAKLLTHAGDDCAPHDHARQAATRRRWLA